MTFKDIYEAMRLYRAVLTQLFERGAEEPGSAAHAELLQLLALKVGFLPMPCMSSLNLPLHMVASSGMRHPGHGCSERLERWVGKKLTQALWRRTNCG